MAYVYTYATHRDRYFDSLMHSCDKVNIRPVVKGMGDKWKGFVVRHNELLRFMKTLRDDDIVINIDGFDTIVLCPLNEIIQKFKSMDCKALFSQTSDNGNMLQKYIQWKLGFHGMKVNAGMFMGYVSKMKEILSKVVKSTHADDQMVINSFVHDDPEIKIDTEYDIFCNISNHSYTNVVDGTLHYKDKTPCILSAPGCVNLNGILRQLDIQTSPYSCNIIGRIREYSKYFIHEIIVLLFVFYILLRNMKRVQKILFG